MAIREILSFDIDKDGNLNKFYKKFEDFRKKLKDMPEAWKSITDELDGTNESFDKLVEKYVAIGAQQRLITEAQAEANRLLDGQPSKWDRATRGIRGAATWSKNLAFNIKDAAFSLTKIVGFGGLIGGIAGYGGLLGLERLIGTASAGRRSSLGLGLTYGEQRAFGVGFGRLVDTRSYLGGVSEALGDVTKRAALYRAGLTEADLGGDTAQVGINLLKRVKDIADRTAPQFLGQAVDVYGLSQFGLTVEDLRRIRKTGKDELAGYFNTYLHGRGPLGIDDVTLKKWQDLNVTLETSKGVIESSLIRGLSPLAPEIESLSTALATTITNVLSDPSFKQGLQDFTKYLGSPDFRNDVKGLAMDIGTLAKAVASALHTMGKHSFWDTAIGGVGGFLVAGPAGAAVAAGIGYEVGKHSDYMAGLHTRFYTGPGVLGYKSPAWYSARGVRTLYNKQLESLGLDKVDAAAIAGNIAWESGGNPFIRGDHGTSYGLAQWHAQRLIALQQFEAAHRGQFKSEADAQLAFLTWELTKGPYKGVLDRMRRAKTLAEKVAIFEKYYENPASPSSSYGKRLALAQQSIKAKADVSLKVKVHNQTGGQVNVNASQLPQ